MINKSEFDILNVGDMIETDGLLRSVAPNEPMVLLVTARNKTSLDFLMHYCNVRVGTARCVREDKGFRWSFELA